MKHTGLSDKKIFLYGEKYIFIPANISFHTGKIISHKGTKTQRIEKKIRLLRVPCVLCKRIYFDLSNAKEFFRDDREPGTGIFGK